MIKKTLCKGFIIKLILSCFAALPRDDDKNFYGEKCEIYLTSTLHLMNQKSRDINSNDD